MIPIPDLKVRGVYRCNGRNFTYGVWNGTCFVGRRHKFGWRLAGEMHYDASESSGTCSPAKLLFMMPEHVAHVTLDTTLRVTDGVGAMNYALFGYLTVVEDDIQANPGDWE